MLESYFQRSQENMLDLVAFPRNYSPLKYYMSQNQEWVHLQVNDA